MATWLHDYHRIGTIRSDLSLRFWPSRLRLVHNGIGRVQVEDGANSLPLLVREEMPIAAALFVGLMAHEFVDDALIDSPGGEVRCE